MFEFLKNHQRKIFIVITVMTVSSFIFFGTFSTFMQSQGEIPDRQVVKSVNGRAIMRRELYALSQLITTSAMHGGRARQGNLPNLFNDGVIEKELLTSGLSLLLAEHYFSDLKPELEARVQKMRHFRPYAHPQAPYLNALGVWQRFTPSLVQHLDLLKKQTGECTLDTLALLIQLYLDQTKLPPDLLKQILLFQQQQQGLPADPLLAQADLSLFGFSTLEEWFGPLFVELNAQFIANAACLAEEKGYEVKQEEIRANLLQNIHSGYKSISPNGDPRELQHYFERKIQQFGLDEKMVFNAWHKVMLFRRLFADVGGSVLVDSLAYRQFQQYSKQNVKIELYELPLASQMRDLQSLFKFQIYLESISPQTKAQKSLALPQDVCSVEQIEARSPELVQRGCEIQYALVKKSLLAGDISLKETWAWEVIDKNWKMLQEQFPLLGKCDAKEATERSRALDALETSTRLSVDAYARSKMLDETPEKIIEALDKATFQKTRITLCVQGGSWPFTGLQERTQLLAALEKAPLIENSEKGEISNNDPLFCFSKDNEHFYRIKVLQRDTHKQVKRFSDALDDGTLELLLTRRLEEVYPEARKKNPRYFQQDKGMWKPLKEVKDEVGRYLFGDLLKNIEDAYQAHIGPLPGKPGELPSLFYGNYRLFFHVEEEKQRIQNGTKIDANPSPLIDQWHLTKSEREVQRCDVFPFSKEEMFAMAPQSWSTTLRGEDGTLAFYQLITPLHSELTPELITQGQEILALDARKQLMLELIELIHRKSAIDIHRGLSDES